MLNGGAGSFVKNFWLGYSKPSVFPFYVYEFQLINDLVNKHVS